MNYKILFLAVLISSTLVSSSNGSISQKDNFNGKISLTSVLDKFKNEYTYVRINKDGVWWT